MCQCLITVMASTHALSMGAINLKVHERGLYPHIGDIEMYKEAGMLSTLRMKFHLKVFKNNMETTGHEQDLWFDPVLFAHNIPFENSLWMFCHL
ncbi:hypothetical protein SCP_0102980 [Sparassis crispa]|uniref:Uncharacterized protein n=1 Tax=Sparassis crispa TaxID=139825 RepID=A0A401G5J5_9APHY|nr:hypothetical protein SCP_0102980 [Sparassis crispa]GBE77424.1 hypothetical protein SCP_0102980 [Sparassis crispa]